MQTAEGEGGDVVLTVAGEVDVHTASRLREALTAAEAAAPPRIVVDLEGVPFMDSTGLGVLVGALARARDSEREVVLASVPPRVGRLLRLTGLDQQFAIQD